MVSDVARGGPGGGAPRGGGPRACAGGGAWRPLLGGARSAPPSAAAAVLPLFLKKRKEVGHFVKQNGVRDVAGHVTNMAPMTFDPEEIVHHFGQAGSAPRPFC